MRDEVEERIMLKSDEEIKLELLVSPLTVSLSPSYLINIPGLHMPISQSKW